MVKYSCAVRGYIYDLELGDPDGGEKPGTRFEEIPDDWVCPVCGVARSDFEKEELNETKRDKARGLFSRSY